jgi:hypothetical protein
VNPCTGSTGTTTQTYKGRDPPHRATRRQLHATTTETYSFTFVPDDPSQPTYAAKGTSWDGANLSSQNNFTATVTGHFIAKGSDGSRLTGHGVAHITVHPDGTITVEFEKDRLSCP